MTKYVKYIFHFVLKLEMFFFLYIIFLKFQQPMEDSLYIFLHSFGRYLLNIEIFNIFFKKKKKKANVMFVALNIFFGWTEVKNGYLDCKGCRHLE